MCSSHDQWTIHHTHLLRNLKGTVTPSPSMYVVDPAAAAAGKSLLIVGAKQSPAWGLDSRGSSCDSASLVMLCLPQQTGRTMQFHPFAAYTVQFELFPAGWVTTRFILITCWSPGVSSKTQVWWREQLPGGWENRSWNRLLGSCPAPRVTICFNWRLRGQWMLSSLLSFVISGSGETNRKRVGKRTARKITDNEFDYRLGILLITSAFTKPCYHMLKLSSFITSRKWMKTVRNK